MNLEAWLSGGGNTKILHVGKANLSDMTVTSKNVRTEETMEA